LQHNDRASGKRFALDVWNIFAARCCCPGHQSTDLWSGYLHSGLV